MARGDDIRAGGAYVELYMKGIEAAGQRLQSFGRRLVGIGASISAAGTAIAAPFALASKAFADAGDKLDKMSIRTRVSVESLSEIGFAAEQTGTSLDQVGNVLFRFGRRVANASKGTGPAVRALRDLGLEATALTKLSVEDQFVAITNALGGVENQSLAAQYAFEIFGDEAKAIMPLLLADIEALRAEARELGITLTREDATAAANLTDAMNRLARVQKAIWLQMGAAVAGPLTEFYNVVGVIGSRIAKWTKDNRELFKTIFLVGVGVAVVGAAVTFLGTAFIGVGVLMASASAIAGVLASAFAFLASPIGIAVTAVAGLSAAFLAFTETGKSIASSIIESFRQIAGEVVASVSAITNALQSGDIESAIEIMTTQGALIWEEFTSSFIDLWEIAVSRVKSTNDFLTSNFASMIAQIGEGWAGLWDYGPEAVMGFAQLVMAVMGSLIDDLLIKFTTLAQWIGDFLSIDTSDLEKGIRDVRGSVLSVTGDFSRSAVGNLDQAAAKAKATQERQARIKEIIVSDAERRAEQREAERLRRREEREKRIAELRGRLSNSVANVGRNSSSPSMSGLFSGQQAEETSGVGVFSTFSARELLGFASGARSNDQKRAADAAERNVAETRALRTSLENIATLA